MSTRQATIPDNTPEDVCPQDRAFVLGDGDGLVRDEEPVVAGGGVGRAVRKVGGGHRTGIVVGVCDRWRSGAGIRRGADKVALVVVVFAPCPSCPSRPRPVPVVRVGVGVKLLVMQGVHFLFQSQGWLQDWSGEPVLCNFIGMCFSGLFNFVMGEFVIFGKKKGE